MRTLVLSLAAAAAIAAAATITGIGFPVGAADAPAPAPLASPAAVVHLKNFAYLPATITVKSGDTVRFVADDDTPHTVTASDKSFDSGSLDQHGTWSHTFALPGTYAYFCIYHPYMKGTVVVR